MSPARLVSGTFAQRSTEFPPDALPIHLRTATLAVISKGRFQPSWSKRYFMAKWVISGEASMRIAGRQYPVLPNHVAIYTPIIPHEFFATAPQSHICWFTADGPDCEHFVHTLGLRRGGVSVWVAAGFDYPNDASGGERRHAAREASR